MAAVEKLVVLNHHANDIIARLAYSRSRCTTGAGGVSLFNTDGKSDADKLLLTIDKKFPDISQIDKVPGYSTIKGKAKPIFEELEPHYYSMVDAYQFSELAAAQLVAAATATTDFFLDNNPMLTELFFDTFCALGRVTMLMHVFEKKKQVLGLYAKLFKYVKQTDEPAFKNVAKWIGDWDPEKMSPLANLAKVFAPIAEKIGQNLASHMLTFSRARSVQTMRKEGALNITHKPEDSTTPASSQYALQLRLMPKIADWVVWSLLCAPDSVAQMGDMAKNVLSEVWIGRLYGDAYIDIHHELSQVTTHHKSKHADKAKRLAKDTAPHAAQSLKVHMERRVFLRQELSQLLHLGTDQPALIGPKLPLYLAAMSMARDEVMIHFAHVGMQQNKKDVLFADKRISDLIHLLVLTRKLVTSHADAIQDYFLGFMSGADHHALSSMVEGEFSAAVGPNVSAICKAVVQELRAAAPGQRNADFRTLRLNYARAEAAMTGKAQNMPLSKIKKVLDRFQLAVFHSRVADSLTELLDECAGLSELHLLQGKLFDAFSLAIREAPIQPLHAVSFLQIVADFPSAAVAADDQKEIGTSAQKLGDKMVGEMVMRIVSLLHEIAKKYIEFDEQVDPNNAIFQMCQEKMLPAKFKKLVSTTGIKQGMVPGTESAFRQRESANLEKLRGHCQNAWQLCAALNQAESIAIFQALLTPREALREKLGERFVKFLRSKVVAKVPTAHGKNEATVLSRPSLFQQQLITYATVLKTAEEFVDIDMDTTLKASLLHEFYAEPFDDITNLAWCDAEDSAFEAKKGTTAGYIVTWYARMLHKQLQTPGIVYSESRLSFVQKTETPTVKEDGGRVEYLTDIRELRSLCEIGGAYLVCMIEREALKIVVEEMKRIKEVIRVNKPVLEDFQRNYRDERKSGETLKKLRDVDVFTAAAVNIGTALAFRKLLLRALGEVTNERAPILFETAQDMMSQYRRNTWMAKELLPSDMLAHCVGCKVEAAADQVLKRFVSKGATRQDQPLWDLLPIMFALSFYSTMWKESEFRAVVDAHDNNVGVIAIAAADMMIALKATTSGSTDEKEITNMLQNFLEVSATVLLRVCQGHSYNKSDKTHVKSPASMMIFLDKFVERCPFLTRDSLEQVVPYSLLVSDWHQVLEIGGAGGKGGRRGPAEGNANNNAAAGGPVEGGKAEDVF